MTQKLRTLGNFKKISLELMTSTQMTNQKADLGTCATKLQKNQL